MNFGKSNKGLKLGLGSLAILLGLLIAVTPLGSALDNLAYDLNFLLRGQQETQQDVLLVAIDEASFQEMAQPWPWPRGTHARLIRSLFEAGAKAVVLDLILADPSNAQQDRLLANTLTEYGPVVLATDVETSSNKNFSRAISVEPLADFLTATVTKGYAALPIYSDSFVRDLGSRSLLGDPSLAQASVNAFNGSSASYQNNPARHGINFIGPTGTFEQVSYYQALSASQFLKPGSVTGKLVFVGLVTQSDVLDQSANRDSYPTPFTRWGDGYMNGVEIHANAAQSILNENQIQRINPLVLLCMALLAASACWWLMYRYPPNRTLLPLAVLLILVMSFSYWLFASRNVYVSWPLLLLPSVLVYVSSPLLHYLLTWRERNFIQKAFSSYVSTEVVSQLVADPELLKLGGTNCHGSVLFLDLEGFTHLSEHMPPQQLLALLNHYLGALSEIAIAEGGLVDKFIGDSIMVVWGAPIEAKSHAQQACLAALKMQSCLDQLGVADEFSLEQPIRARIGVNSGEFVAGNIGSAQKLEYTVLGDTVNLASRLEGLNKVYGSRIIVSEQTATQLGDGFLLREIDQVRVKGKRDSVRVHELLGKGDSEVSPLAISEACAQRFQDARGLYVKGDFSAAAKLFELCSREHPDDQVSKAMAKRCYDFVDSPPLNWRGVFEL